jgi:hypothetical protein
MKLDYYLEIVSETVSERSKIYIFYFFILFFVFAAINPWTPQNQIYPVLSANHWRVSMFCGVLFGFFLYPGI